MKNIYYFLAIALPLGWVGMNAVQGEETVFKRVGSSTTISTTQQDPAVVPPPPTSTTTTTIKQVSPSSTTVTTSTTQPGEPRKVYDEKTLKDIADNLCKDGFKAYVGSEGKNVCKNWADPPDIAFTCKWDRDGPPAFAPGVQGPCNLDFAEHRGSLIITRQQFKDNPPLKYGDMVYCCYRSASGN